MAKTSAPCSIVIRAYNEEKHIGRLLEGIARQDIEDVQIILVDSGSTDATLAIASRYPVEILSIHPDDFTFGRSLNLGCSHARSEFIVIASAHVYPVYPDWLRQLLRPFEDPGVALAYGKQRGNATTRYSEHQHFAKMFPEHSDPHQRNPLCNNANAAIRRSLWQEHPYDEELPGLEDVAWASWALDRGYHLAYSAEAEVIHVHNETPRQVFNRYRREAMALRRIQPQEYFHFWDFVRLFPTNVLSDCLHAFRERCFLREFRGIVTFRFMQFWGTYRGFRYAGPLTGQLKQAFYYPRGLSGQKEPSKRAVPPLDYGSVELDVDPRG